MLTVFRKRRVHKTVNLLTGKADANPDIVDVVKLEFDSSNNNIYRFKFVNA